MKWQLLLFAAFFVLGVTLAPANDRKQVIDFEDEMIEGLNKKPLDSLSQISEKDRNRRNFHLYRKRVGFSHESQTLIKEMRYIQ